MTVQRFRLLRLQFVAQAVVAALLTLCITPVQAAVVVPPPTAIDVSQDGFVMSADITIDDTQVVGTVTIQVGANSPVTIAKPDSYGIYSRTLTAADIGSNVVFRATAVSQVGSKLVTSDWFESRPFLFTRAATPKQMQVSQDGTTLLLAVTYAPGTTLGVLSMKVGTGTYSTVCNANAGENCGDSPYEVDMTMAQIGKQITFRVVTTPVSDAIPDSVQAFSDPFTFAQAVPPSSVSLSQDGYNLNVAAVLPAGESVGDVIVRTFSTPDGDSVDPTNGQYVYELSTEDLGHVVRVSVAANAPGQVMSTYKTATFTPGVAGAVKLGSLKQATNVVTATVAVPDGTALSIQAVMNEQDRVVSVSRGVASVALVPSDAGKVLYIYAHGTKSGVPDSDEVDSEAFTIAGAAAPTAVVVTQQDADVCAKPELDVNQTVGVMTATVGGVARTVVVAGGKRCITLSRADLGKEIVFGASARHVGQVDSEAVASDAYVAQAAAKPKVKLSQKGKVITAAIQVGVGQQVGVTTYVVGKSAPVVVKPVKGKYTFKVTSANVGKKVIVRTCATQSGFFPSVAVTSAALKIKK